MFIFQTRYSPTNIASEEIFREAPAQKITRIDAYAKNNRDLVKDLQNSGMKNIQIVDDKGKTYPPPNAFWKLDGFNKIQNFTITGQVDVGDGTFGSVSIEKKGKAVPVINFVQAPQEGVSESQTTEYSKSFKFLQEKGDEIPKEDRKGIENGTINPLEYIKKRGWDDEFQKWLQQQLQRKESGGEVKVSSDERVASNVWQGIINERGNKELADVQDREKDAVKKGGGDVA